MELPPQAMLKGKTILLLGIIASECTSCALIINGRKQRISIVTDTPGAQVYLNDIAMDTTPCVIQVKRSINPPALYVSKAGFKKSEIPLKTKFNETAILNFFNPFGWIIDLGIGTSIKYQPLDTIQLQTEFKSKN